MQASQLTDQEHVCAQLYQQADRILVQAAAILPLVYLRYPFLQKPWLTVPLRDRSNPSKDIIIHRISCGQICACSSWGSAC